MDNSGDKSTPISSFGKFRLIELLTKKAVKNNISTISEIGDDAAVVDHGSSLTLISTDLLLEGIHFNLVYSPLKHLGYKSVIRAISDIYAMNGDPGQVLVSLGLSSRFSVEQAGDIFEGIYMACEKYGVDLAGGDTTSSVTGLSIGVTAVGMVEKNNLVKRSGAGPNDLICVTGNLGAAFMGLQLLERERKLFIRDKVTQPDLTGHEYILERQLKPEFPVNVLEELRSRAVIPTAMIDVTEGLASDLLSICLVSGTGCRIFYSKIPVAFETTRMAEEFNIDPLTAALNGGEDYELLFTVPVDLFEKVKDIKAVTVIGHMTSTGSSCVIAGDDGSEAEITSMGWK